MDALIIMTRVPIPNKTKTRLMDIYTGVECSRLHQCFLMDIFKICEKLKDRMDIYLSYTPDDAYGRLAELVPDFISSFPQKGPNLGERMHNSIKYILDKKYEKVILMGSDIPELKIEAVTVALEKLDLTDLCLGPTYDGGYYLIGMKKPCHGLFNSKLNWGYSTVFDRTVKLAENKGLQVSYTHKCRDIDTKEDIREFLMSVNSQEEDYPQNTCSYLENNWRDCFLGEVINE